MYVLPDSHGKVASKDGHRCATRKSIETISEIHGVSARKRNQGNPQHHEDSTAYSPSSHEVERKITHKRNRRRGGGHSRRIRKLKHQIRKRKSHRQQTNSLLVLGKSFVPLVAELHNIVGGTDSEHS